MKSRYENISTEIIYMKELITAINHRFDQVYTKIDILNEKVDSLKELTTTLNTGFNSFEANLDKLDEKVDTLSQLTLLICQKLDIKTDGIIKPKNTP